MRQEQKNFVKALDDGLDAESRLPLIIDTTPALIYSARSDGYIDFFNQHCLEFLGLPFEEISGWKSTKTVHPDDIEGVLAKWRAAPNRFKPLHYRPYLVSTCKMQKRFKERKILACRERPTFVVSTPTADTTLTRDRVTMRP